MSGSNNDPPEPRRGAVLPPPSLAPDDLPAPVVPRMEPPPASLEAMVHGVAAARDSAIPAWLPWLVLAGAAAAVAGYILR